MNSLEYAYIGDAIYEVYIRRYLIDKGIRKVNNLQKEAKKYVSAVSQANYMFTLLNSNFFTSEELDIINRARNYKTNSKPKNVDIATYKVATGLEAIIGFLYLYGNISRINEIMNQILGDNNYVCVW